MSRQVVRWLAVVLAGLLTCAAVVAAERRDPNAERAVDRCRSDLAARLQVPAGTIHLLRVDARSFSDASLGLPQPGKMYAQVVTPGYRVILESRNTGYLYTSGGAATRYGGPLTSWRASAVYLEPVPDEPNLNGNLVGQSLVGTHPAVLLPLVSQVWPQENGGVLGIRRTSRSGHDLLYLAPGAKEPTVLGSAFAFVGAALSPDAARWIACRRSRVGGTWEIGLGTVGGEGKILPMPLDGRPIGVAWLADGPVAGVRQGDRETWHLLGADGAWHTRGYRPDGDVPLNKSQHLEVRAATENGQPVVTVSTVWFTGDATRVATIRGTKLRGSAVTPDLRFVLVDGAPRACTVDLHTGEVIDTATDAPSAVMLLAAPPHGAHDLLQEVAP